MRSKVTKTISREARCSGMMKMKSSNLILRMKMSDE